MVTEYTDTISGSIDSRPGLNRLIQDAGSIFDIVVFTRLDRIGRSSAYTMRVLELLGTLDVKIVSLNEGLDLTTPAGQFMAKIFAAFGQLERDIIIERTRAGLARVRAQGKKLGPPMKVSLVLEKEILSYKGKLTCKAAAEKFGVSASTVSRIYRQKYTPAFPVNFPVSDSTIPGKPLCDENE